MKIIPLEQKQTTYNSIIKTLQTNDRNATYDEILQEHENNLTESILDLQQILIRIVNEEGLEGEELGFYIDQLNRVNTIAY